MYLGGEKMSLRFIYGKAGSGKTLFCLNDIKREVTKDEEKKIILLIPEQYSYMAQKNIFSLLKEDKSNKIIIWDFKKMAKDILKDLGFINRNYLDSSGRSMLIYEILKRKKAEFKTFSMAAQKKGFTGIISGLISEFKRFNVSAETLDAVINDMEDSELKDKLGDINLIYSELETEIKDRFIDIEDNLSFLLNQDSAFDVFKNSIVYIDEFKSFTPVQYQILSRILKLSSMVNITLNYEDINKDNIIFADIKNTEDRINRILEENNIPIEEPIFLKGQGRFKDNPDLSFLEQEFFSYPNRVNKGAVKNIKLFRSINRFGEVIHAADEIIRLIRDEGLRFKEIAVVTRDLDLYKSIINSVFKEYEIPNFTDDKKEITGNIIVLLFNSLLKIYKNNWSYDGVFTLLKTGLLGLTDGDISLLENYIIASGIRGRNKWKETFEYKAYGFEDSLSEINEIRKTVVKPISKILNSVKGQHSIKEYAKTLYEFMEDIDLYNQILRLIEDYNNQGFISFGLEYKQIYNIVLATLDQIVEVMGDTEASFEDFMNILLSGFDDKKIGVIPAAIDEVIVSSCDRLRSSNIKALFLLGINDGVFPRGGIEEGILKDTDREALEKMNIELAKTTKNQVYDEQYLIYKTLTLSSDKLYLSYAVSDEEGKALRPSYIINRIKKLFTNIEEESDLLNQGDEVIISSKLPTFNRLLLNVNKENNEDFDHVFSFFLKDTEYKERVKRAFDSIKYRDNTSIGEIAPKLYGNLNFSASRIETYLKCPFSYYAKYGLNLKERQEFSLSGLDIGSFLHFILEYFSKDILESGRSWDELNRDDIKKSVRSLVDIYINNSKGSVFESSSRYKYFKERLISLSVKTIEIIVLGLKSSSFKPKYIEKEFNNESSFTPLCIKLNHGEIVNIIGKIDRIDVFKQDGETYIRIIDYKSGIKDFSLNDLYYGTAIQLLLYLHVALCNEKGLPAGMFYFKLDDPIVKSKFNIPDEVIEDEINKSFRMKGASTSDINIIRKMDNAISGASFSIPVKLNNDGSLSKASSVLSEADFEDLRTYLEKLIKESCDRMLQGDIKAYPVVTGTSSACDFCPYSSICQFDPGSKGCSYNYLRQISDEDVLLKIREEIK